MRLRKEVVMALEQVFECPRTLSRLRSGPLGNLLDELELGCFSMATGAGQSVHTSVTYLTLTSIWMDLGMESARALV